MWPLSPGGRDAWPSTTLNGSFAEDSVFVPIAITMVFGFGGAARVAAEPPEPDWVADSSSSSADWWTSPAPTPVKTNPGSVQGFGASAAALCDTLWLGKRAALVLLVSCSFQREGFRGRR